MDRRIWKEPVGERIVAEGIFLEHRAGLRITHGARLLVSAHGGTLWITEEGNPADFLVEPGTWYRIKTDAPTLVYAMEPASVTISAPLAIPARWTVDGRGPGGRPNGVRIAPRKRGGQTGRDLWAWVLRRYRAGAHAGRRMRQSAREAEQRESVARFAAQLDARTRRDIGLEPFHGASAAERAERYRWRHDFSSPARESPFI
jgi:hypothetical protein